MSAAQPQAKKASKKAPKKRARLRLGDCTLVIQRLKGGRAALVTYSPGAAPNQRKREKVEYGTLGAAQTAFELRVREAERVGVNAASSIGDADRLAVAKFYQSTAGWASKPSVAAALAEYVDRHETQRSSLTFSDALARRVEEAEARGTTPRHVINVKSRVRGFLAKHGATPISDITPDEINAFINAMPVSPRSRADTLNDISSVFAAAVRAGKLERNPAATVRPPKILAPETGVITAAELARLLAALPARSVAAVAVMALAGLRRSEADKLKWPNVRLSDGIIVVTAGTAKTGARRTVPIVPALAQWLTRHKQTEGQVAPASMTYRRDLEDAVQAAKIVPWPRNALRHGAASAWVATEQDIAKVAAWLGHAPAVLNRHYKNLLTPAEGKAWLATAPPAKSKPARKRAPKVTTTPTEASVKPLADVIEFPRAG